MNETLLAALYLPLSERIRAVLQEAGKTGLPPVDIFMGVRTFAEQDALYAKGRTVVNPDGRTAEKPLGNMVTKAPGGSSWHNYGLAADLVFRPGGNWSWADSLPWKALGAIGVSCGLEWGGSWKFKDTPHFQMIGSLTLPMAKELYLTGGFQAVWSKLVKPA